MSARVGPAASLARFQLAVGHSSDADGATGCTVIRGIDGPHRAACAVIGRATGSRELALLTPGHLDEAYGLDAAAGVMRWMEEHGRGFAVGPGVVPIVPAAVIFDLLPLGSFSARPTPAMAYAACRAHARAVDGTTAIILCGGNVGTGTLRGVLSSP